MSFNNFENLEKVLMYLIIFSLIFLFWLIYGICIYRTLVHKFNYSISEIVEPPSETVDETIDEMLIRLMDDKKQTYEDTKYHKDQARKESEIVAALHSAVSRLKR